MEEDNKLNDGANDGENSQDCDEKKSELSQTGSFREETNTQLDESSQLSQDNDSKEEQKDSIEKEKFDDTEINTKNLEILQNDINYGIVLAFINKFGKHFSFKEIKFEQFENSLINIRNLNKNLSDFLLNLLKNLSFGKYVKKEKFDYYMTKFAGRFCENDALEIEKNGYIKLKIEAKIIIVKNLLECQFDENPKLKQIIADQIPDQNSLRTEPNGKDVNGLWYFVYMDSDCSIRVFSINYKDLAQNSTSWKLEAKNLNDLKSLVEKLSSQPEVVKLRSSKKYQENKNKINENSQSCDENKLETEEKEELKDNVCLDSQEKQDDEKQAKQEHKLEFKEESETKADIELENEKVEPKIEKIESNDQVKEENIEKTPEKNEKESENKIEKIESNEQIKEENIEKTPEKNEKESGNKFEIEEPEPIALRKSTRSSVRKMQEAEQLKATPKPKINSTKSTPKSNKKSTKKSSKKKSSKQKSSTIEYIEDDVDDEELDEEDDDEEFAPSPSKKKAQICPKKKSRQKNKPNLLDYESGSTISDEFDQESACIKCKKVKSKQILILCDGCDAPYHIGCLKPPLLEIPEGDWFCDICTHDKLISYLEQKIELIEKHNQELEATKLAKQNQKPAYTDISAYLDNLFSSNVGRKIKNEKPKKSIFEETVLDGPRSCRLKSRVRYTFEDFDKSINQACGEEEEDQEEKIFEPRPTRSTRRSSRLNEYVDNYNSGVESDAGSNSSEYKASIKRPKYESEEISEEEPESDEDFKASKKKHRSERVNRKKSKKSKKRKTKSKYCDDTESDVDETEEEEEEELVYSDDEEANKGRYSRGKLKVLQKWSDDESAKTSDQEYSNGSSVKKRSTRTKSNKNYCESSDENDKETENENEEKSKSRIKKPWLSDDEKDETPAKKARPIIKRPWSDDDSNEAKSESKDVKQNEKSETGQMSEESNKQNLPTNTCMSSVIANKSQVMINQAPTQITVENKPINTIPQANFVPNNFITTATPLVYYYCQPTHIPTLQPTPVIQMNGQIPNQLQPIVLMNIPSQGFIKPS